jgi:translation initiation factor IF-2
VSLNFKIIRWLDMTDNMEPTKKTPKKKLSLASPGKLEMQKTIGGGQVRQSFSHGRSKVVAVEVKKKRIFAPGLSGNMSEVISEAILKDEPSIEEVVVEEPVDQATSLTPTVPHNLTDQERAARAQALQEAKKIEEQQERKIPENPSINVEQSTGLKVISEAEKLEIEKEKLRQATLEMEAAEAAAAKSSLDKAVSKTDNEETKNKMSPPKRPAAAPRQGERRRSGKLTIADALDDSERQRSLASLKRQRERQKRREGPIQHIKIVREVTIPETISVQELSNRMAARGVDVIKTLMKMGVMAKMNETIDADTAELVVEEFGHTVNRVSDSDIEIGLGDREDKHEDLVLRSPIVTIMGHVDHGKTSLLDVMRKANVVSGEAGGITQHIGAYQTTTDGGQKITFIDTPGHEAFTAMRARGAAVTDIVVLVVAADDGIMPQTIEAINHAKSAEVPIIVAINKIDRPDANPTRIRNQLLEHELVLEAMGGDILDVEVSATEATNIDKLEEAILLQAEIQDLKANPSCSAEGVVIEARVEQGRGAVATVLIKRGKLEIGNIFVAGSESGRVRALVSDQGQNVTEAGPSVPVEIVGFSGAPVAGDEFFVVSSEARAREVAEFRSEKSQIAKTVAGKRGTLEEMFESIKAGDVQELPVLVKVDVQGSGEAIVGMFEKLPQNEVKINVIHRGVGGINESDVTLAGTSGAVIFGFNVRANNQARDLARQDGVDIRYYSVIYDVIDDIKKLLIGKMAPIIRETFLGNAEVRDVFNVSKIGKVAGCFITNGEVKRGSGVRLLRDNVVIHEGSLSTLKRFKDDVSEVKESFECGMSFASYNDIKVGDIIECFDVTEEVPEI